MSTTADLASQPPVSPPQPKARQGSRVGLTAVLVGIGLGAVVLAGLYWIVTQPGSPTATAAAGQESSPAPDTKPASPAVIITTSPVQIADVQRRLKAVGTLEGYEEISLSPQVGGRILAIHKDVGDLVAPGDLLMEIDPQDALLAVKEAHSSLDLELSKLGLKTPPAEDFDVEQVPAVQKSVLLEQNALRTLERYRQLALQKVTTQDDLEKAETNYRVAVVEARQQRLLAGETLAAIRQKIALLKTAEKRLADTRVVVPPLTCLEGSSKVPCSPVLTVAERHVSEGENVVATQVTALYLLVMEHPLKLRAQLPERAVGQVKVGQPVEVAVEAYPGEKFQGLVKRVNPTIQRASRTFEIEVAIPNEERRLKAGSFGVAEILVDHNPTAVIVPESAIIKFAGVVKLFKVTPENLALEVPVVLGERIERRENGGIVPYVEVTGAVQPGEAVVTSGQSQLVDGVEVRLRTAVAATPAAQEAPATGTKGSHE